MDEQTAAFGKAITSAIARIEGEHLATQILLVAMFSAMPDGEAKRAIREGFRQGREAATLAVLDCPHSDALLEGFRDTARALNVEEQ